MPYIGRAPSASIIKLEDADQDTKIQVEESSDEDIIRFDIAGAEDFTMTANSFNVLAGSNIDLNGTELILDADADTSITADTDDTIDIRIAGADDFQFTANTLSVLSGSTLNIDSGATITNNGTATGFDPAIAAASGIMEADADFVDAVIFGPAMDPVDWSGRTAASTASLMLATVEQNGLYADVTVWDLTSTTIASATKLATVQIALGGGAVVYSVAAAMGYIVVGKSTGVSFVDPHSGSWAERMIGWPKTLDTSTTPALTNLSVIAVAAGFSDQPAYDPRTGGPMPTFAVGYGSGADAVSVLKTDGNVFDRAGTSGNRGVAIWGGRVWYALGGTGDILNTGVKIDNITADDWTQFIANASTEAPQGLGCENAASFEGDTGATASDLGLTVMLPSYPIAGSYFNTLNALVNRTYNSGFLLGDIRGAWLANSKTVDRSYKANTLTENGTVTEAVVETSAELKGYSGFSASNNLTRASDADWDVITTGSAYMSIWFKSSGNSGVETLIGFGNSGGTIEFSIKLFTTGLPQWYDDGATGAIISASGPVIDDGVWHKLDFVRVSSTERYGYTDGVLVYTDTSDAGSLTGSGALPLGIGVEGDGSTLPALTSTVALAHLSVTAPTATQVRQMYDAEKGMFVASAKCLLQSSSTDAVLDVSVDPITSKVAVTQTDSQMIWNGLVMESAPAVNAGASEHNLLYGGDRVEINSVNLYATIAAKNLRGDLDIVRGMKAGLPAGVDLSKAKAWCVWNHSLNVILASYNVKSVTDVGLGKTDVFWSVPFKSDNYVAHTSSASNTHNTSPAARDKDSVSIYVRNDAGSYADSGYVVCTAFGELENE